MSFKDVRDLSEHLKLLGYPNAFPLSLLYTTYGGPNSFRIVADILQWLAERFEPGTVLAGGTKDSTERISLIRSAAEFFITKATIKLNPRKLYVSSSVAATELLKITSLLKNAPAEIDIDEEQYKNNNINIDLDDKIDDLRRARELSTDLTNIGATLYDLLSKELLNKVLETRTVQATRSLELVSVERSLKTAITLMNQKLQTSKLQLETSRNEKNALQSKLDRKSSDLERLKQRLEALHKIRPAYLEEFERLEIDLKNLYDQYFIRVRCLDALRTQLQTRVKTPSAITIAIPLTSNPHENSMNFLPDGLIIDSDDENILIDDDDGDGDDFGIGDDDDDDDDDDDYNVFKKNVKNNLRAASNLLNKNDIKDDGSKTNGNVRPTTNNRLRIRTGIPRTRFVGSMTGNSGGGGGGGGGTADLDSSDDSESDLDIVDDLRSDDDELIAKLTASPTITSKINKTDHRSDEDF